MSRSLPSVAAARADRHHLGMRGRIAIGQRAVAGLRDHRAGAHDHAADRHLAGGGRRAGLVERKVHEGRHVAGRYGSSVCPELAITSADGRASRCVAERGEQRDHHGRGERIAKVDCARGARLAARGGAWIAAGRVSGQRRGDRLAGRSTSRRRTRIAVDGRAAARGASARGCFCYHKPRGLRDHARRPARPADHLRGFCRSICRASSASAGSTSTPRGCSCSPTTAGLPACSSCRRPAGCGATACARMAG